MSTDVFPQLLHTNIIMSTLLKKGPSSIYEVWYGLGNTFYFGTRPIWCLFRRVSWTI